LPKQLPVAVICQLLHQDIIVVTHAKTDRGQGDALAGFIFDRIPDALCAGVANIGDAIRA